MLSSCIFLASLTTITGWNTIYLNPRILSTRSTSSTTINNSNDVGIVSRNCQHNDLFSERCRHKRNIATWKHKGRKTLYVISDNVSSEVDAICATMTAMDIETAQNLSTSPTDEMLDIMSKPLPAHTFSGQVERALKEKFDINKIKRILQSLHLLELNYEHIEWFPSSKQGDGMFYKQHAPSYVPGGLSVRPFWRTNEGSILDEEYIKNNKSSIKILDDWCHLLEDNYDSIRQDFDNSMKNPIRLQEKGNNVWASALTDDASSYGLGWKTLVLYDRGTWDKKNVSLFPQTCQFLKKNLPEDFAVEIFFAQMDPNSSIKPHSDFTNFVLTSHLALDIPESGQNKCRLSVGDTTQEWINGKVTVFDTSLMHDAVNETNETRYILMFRIWHPNLSVEERQALQFIYDCLVIPELATTTSPDERFLAEQQLQVLRSFPSDILTKSTIFDEKTKGTSRRKNSSGFGSSESSGNKRSGKKKIRRTKAAGFGSK